MKAKSYVNVKGKRRVLLELSEKEAGAIVALTGNLRPDWETATTDWFKASVRVFNAIDGLLVNPDFGDLVEGDYRPVKNLPEMVWK